MLRNRALLKLILPALITLTLYGFVFALYAPEGLTDPFAAADRGSFFRSALEMGGY